MIRKPVVSSDIRSIGYDGENQVLEIEFNSGGVYQYYSVPRVVYNGLMNAASHGKYFHTHVKDAFRCQRIQ